MHEGLTVCVSLRRVLHTIKCIEVSGMTLSTVNAVLHKTKQK